MRRTTPAVWAIGVPPDTGPPPPPPPPAPRRTRLAASVISAPRQLDVYFEGNLYRRALWTCIAFAAGARACIRLQAPSSVRSAMLLFV